MRLRQCWRVHDVRIPKVLIIRIFITICAVSKAHTHNFESRSAVRLRAEEACCNSTRMKWIFFILITFRNHLIHRKKKYKINGQIKRPHTWFRLRWQVLFHCEWNSHWMCIVALMFVSSFFVVSLRVSDRRRFTQSNFFSSVAFISFQFFSTFVSLLPIVLAWWRTEEQSRNIHCSILFGEKPFNDLEI